MNTSIKTVSMARTAPRLNNVKDYSEFKVEGRKGRADSRTRRGLRNHKRNWNEEK